MKSPSGVLRTVLLVAAAAGAGGPCVAGETVQGEDAWGLLRAGEVEAAAERFALRLTQDATDVDARVGRVRALVAGQRWREALAEARLHAARLPGEARVGAALGEALFRAGRFEEAEGVVTTLAETSEPPARALLTLGRLRAAEGRQPEARRLAARALDVAADDRDILYWASGLADTRAGAVELLVRYLDLAAGDDPDRIEAARGTLRLFQALGERTIWADIDRPPRLELPLGVLWDPGSALTRGYIVKAVLGEKAKPVPLLLDSGSAGLLVIERVARKRGLVPLAMTVSFGGGGSGRHEQARGLFETIDLGGLSFASVLATVASGELDPTGRFHGLLGLSAFNGYRVTLDLHGKRLTLERTSEPVAGARYWNVAGQWLVRAELQPGESGLFLLYSGATRTQVAADLAQRIEGARLGPETAIRGVGGRIEGARRLDGLRVIFQDLAGEPADLRAVDLSRQSAAGGVEISGMIGLDVLDGAVLVIDTVNRTVSARRPRGR